MTSSSDEIIKSLNDYISDDYTELWVVVSKVIEGNENMTFTEVIEITKYVIGELVRQYDIHLIDERTETPIQLQPEEVVRIVESKLTSMNRLPTIGDGIWFGKK